MPERHSSSDTLSLSRQVADHLGIQAIHEDISEILDAVGCYRRQEEAIRWFALLMGQVGNRKLSLRVLSRVSGSESSPSWRSRLPENKSKPA